MDKVGKFLHKIMSEAVSVDLHEVFGDLDRFIDSVEKKGKRLVIRVSDPTALFVVRRMEGKVRDAFPDVEEVRFLLSN